MGYDNRYVTDHRLRLDPSREAEFCAAVAVLAELDEPPACFDDAIYQFSFIADIEDDGTARVFDLDWMSGDSWSDAVFDLMASYVRPGDYVEMRHIDGDDGSVTEEKYAFDGLGAWEYRVAEWSSIDHGHSTGNASRSPGPL